jgi:hypothetical protein
MTDARLIQEADIGIAEMWGGLRISRDGGHFQAFCNFRHPVI